MSFDRINEALCAAMENPPPSISSSDGTVFVCHATEAEWDAFTVSEDPAPALKTNCLEWFEATNEIHIVEFAPYVPHESLVAALMGAFMADRGMRRWLACRGGSSTRIRPTFAPDLHLGPTWDTPGTVRPDPEMRWSDFNTIKVEIGVSQRWGDRPGQLDHKAVSVWARTLGVEYVLCIKTNDDYSLAEYKLYDLRVRTKPGNRVALVPHATPIVAGTTIAFDAHRILGIPAEMPLPPIAPGRVFPDRYRIDINDVLDVARLNAHD